MQILEVESDSRRGWCLQNNLNFDLLKKCIQTASVFAERLGIELEQIEAELNQRGGIVHFKKDKDIQETYTIDKDGGQSS